MHTDKMKAVSQRFIEEVWNQGKMDVIEEIFAQGFTLNGRAIGHEGIKQFVSMFRMGFPDVHLAIVEQIAVEDRLVTRTRSRGTHHGNFMGMSATGKQIDIGAITISRFDNDKVIEEWEYNDGLSMYRQLGLIPSRDRM